MIFYNSPFNREGWPGNRVLRYLVGALSLGTVLSVLMPGPGDRLIAGGARILFAICVYTLVFLPLYGFLRLRSRANARTDAPDATGRVANRRVFSRCVVIADIVATLRVNCFVPLFLGYLHGTRAMWSQYLWEAFSVALSFLGACIFGWAAPVE